MVRLAVAGQLADSRSIVREQELTERMLDVITAAQQSSPVARLVLERQLRVDTRRAHADVPSDAREQLTRLARAYEDLRNQPPGRNRTRQMDKLVGEARPYTRDARYEPEETIALLSSESAGDRIVGLATVQATGDPRTFDQVLAIVAKPATAFEQFNALRGLESLRPSLTPEQRSQVTSTLTAPAWRKELDDDTSRVTLADRILAAMSADPSTS
jgi:hypothetical protein